MFCTQCGAQNHPDSKFCAACGAAIVLSSVPASPTPYLSADGVQLRAAPRYAGFWFRTLAAVVDGVLVQVATILLVFPLGFSMGASMADSASPEGIEAAAGVMGFFVGLLMQWLWFTVAEASPWQASLGKKLLGLKVTNEEGGRIGFAEANVRYWSKILSALLLCIGFLMVGFTDRKQGLHDKIARTLVVKAGA